MPDTMKLNYLYNAIVKLEMKVTQHKECLTGFRDPDIVKLEDHADQINDLALFTKTNRKVRDGVEDMVREHDNFLARFNNLANNFNEQ